MLRLLLRLLLTADTDTAGLVTDTEPVPECKIIFTTTAITTDVPVRCQLQQPI